MSFFKCFLLVLLIGTVHAQEPEAAENPDKAAAHDDKAKITTVIFRNTVRNGGNKIPITFGQIFKVGDVPKGSSVKLRDATGAALPSQLDVKARHADGSLRHAILSSILPRSVGSVAIDLIRVSDAPNMEKAIESDDIDAKIIFDIEGQSYTVAIEEVLSNTTMRPWLAGAVVTEWPFVAPLRDRTGRNHPHLMLRGNVRKYRTGDLRFDFVVENGWAFAPKPRDYTYDVRVQFGGKTVYEKLDLEHFHLSRWRKVLWRGTDAKVTVEQDPNYMIETRAVPAYDLQVRISPQFFDNYAKFLATPLFEPMGRGIVTLSMATTGGRPEIGPLPAWGAAHIISQSPVTWAMTLAMGNQAGSWPVHYRDQKTDLPATIDDYPYMTLLGTEASAFNKGTGKSEWFPSCEGRCKSPFGPDSSHQPSFAFLPYLLTGDYFYLEELLFWANWNLLELAPPYRNNNEGLLKPGQVRAQAWGLRTLAQAAYIAPDTHPLKSYFVTKLRNNLAWYNKNFPQNPNANKLGVLTSGYAIVSNDGTALPPWQDDFFTWAIGYVWGLGFSDAQPMLKWKARFPVGRMINPDYCWIFATEFVVKVRANKNAERLFDSFEEIYLGSVGERVNSKGVRLTDVSCGGREMADWLTTFWNDAKPGSPRAAPREMVGYAYSSEGFPAILQPALAAAVDAGAPGANEAWRRFMSRAVLPDYANGPQFAVVPLKSPVR